MRRTKWRGTILFAVIMVVMGATVGLRLYDLGGAQTTAAATATTAPAAGGAASPTPTPTPTASAATGAGAAAPAASASPTATPSTAAAAATRIITGAVEQNRYGPFQVQVTFTGSTISAVQVLQSPADGRSQRINEQAIPLLEQEAIAAQSANIDTVSGATYTSESYKQSLQSAIDQL